MISRSVETRIDIDASPEVVWEVLTDFRSYGQWNPLIRSVCGRLMLHQDLAFTVATGRNTAVSARARILAVNPPARLAWGGGMPLGLFRGEHSFTIAPRAGGVEVRNLERFSGLLAPLLINPARLRAQKAAFEACDQALKVRAESMMNRNLSQS